MEDELRAVVEELIARCEALDLEAAFAVSSRSPDFLMMGADGSLGDFEAFYRNNAEYFAECTAFEIETIDDDIRVLPGGLVRYAWVYRVVATLKTGEKDIFDEAGATFLFDKSGGTWKAVYYQESAQPPRRVPAGA